MSHSLVYMTFPDREAALSICRRLVEDRLVACANVLGAATSLYRWDGKLCEDAEVVAVAKTSTALVGAVTDAVKSLHPYDCPCVVALPIAGGNPAYLAWLDAETAAPKTKPDRASQIGAT